VTTGPAIGRTCLVTSRALMLRRVFGSVARQVKGEAAAGAGPTLTRAGLLTHDRPPVVEGGGRVVP